MLATLSSIDYGVILFYLASMLGLGVYFAGTQKDTQEFFLASRSLGWFPLGMSLMATLISALTYTGLPGQAYEHGLKCLVIPLSFWLILPITVGVVLPIYRGLGLYSLYEYLELRFDSQTRLIGSFIFVVWRLLWLGGVIYAPCRALIISAGWEMPDWPLLVLLGVVTTLYTFLGGMKAVVWTDVVQGFAMLGGIVVVVVGVWMGLSGGPARVTEVAAEFHRLPIADFRFSWTDKWCLWAALPHWFLANLSFYVADQITSQRFLSAKDVNAARNSYLLNVLALSFLLPGLIYIGLCLLAYYHDHPQHLEPQWVASLDNRSNPQGISKQPARNAAGKPLLDDRNPDQIVNGKNIHELVKERRLLQPNTRDPFTSADELLDPHTGQVLVEKLLMRTPAHDGAPGEVLLRAGAPEKMLPLFIAKHLPWGMAGLILAALMAASMSSIDSGLNSICTLLIMDFHRRYGFGRKWLADRLKKRPEDLNEADELRLAQPMTLLVGLAATAFSLLVAQINDIFSIMVGVANTFGAPLLAVFLLGIFTRRCTAAAALAAMILGMIFTVGMTAINKLATSGALDPRIWLIGDVWTVTFGVVFTLVVGYGLSFFIGRRKTTLELRGLVYGVGHLGVLAVDEEMPLIGDPEAEPTDEIRWK